MTNRIRMFVCSLAVLLGFVLPVHAVAPLKIGDPAPKLQVGQWVQGDPVKNFETGKVYVVEFWATWCGPCRITIPELNALYQQYNGKVIVIGQNVWEQDESGVVPFVKKMGTNMTYRVALDDKSHDEKGAMAVNWMDASGRNGIPSAFIVDQQGRIAWMGNAMQMTSNLWNNILSGHWDLAKAAADYEKAEVNEQRMQELNFKLNAAIHSGNWDQANAALNEMAKLDPEEAINAEFIRFQLLLIQKKYDDAYKVARSLSDAHPDEAQLQKQLSWMITTRPGIEKRDTAFAEKLAERANSTTAGKDPSALRALARAQFMNDNKKEAIATAQKALDVAEPEQQAELKANLKSYQDGKLPEVTN